MNAFPASDQQRRGMVAAGKLSEIQTRIRSRRITEVTTFLHFTVTHTRLAPLPWHSSLRRKAFRASTRLTTILGLPKNQMLMNWYGEVPATTGGSVHPVRFMVGPDLVGEVPCLQILLGGLLPILLPSGRVCRHPRSKRFCS